MPQAAQDGHGLTLAFAGFVYNILSVGGPNMSRESIETTHMGTDTWKTFIPADLIDGGELTVELQYDTSSVPPIDGPVQEMTITWGNSEADELVFMAFMTGFSPSGGESGAIMKASATFKVTGEPEVNPA